MKNFFIETEEQNLNINQEKITPMLVEDNIENNVNGEELLMEEYLKFDKPQIISHVIDITTTMNVYQKQQEFNSNIFEIENNINVHQQQPKLFSNIIDTEYMSFHEPQQLFTSDITDIDNINFHQPEQFTSDIIDIENIDFNQQEQEQNSVSNLDTILTRSMDVLYNE